MEKADSARPPTWKSVYAPARQKPQLNPAGGAEGTMARPGRELTSASHSAACASKPAGTAKEVNNASICAATPTRHSVPSLRPTNVNSIAAARGFKCPPGVKAKQQFQRTTPNHSRRGTSDPDAPSRQLQCSQQQGHEQDDPVQQLIPDSKPPSANHAGNNEQPEALAAGLQEASPESEPGAAGRRASSSPRQSRQLSPYLAALPRPTSSMPRRPRSPGPRPGSPLCGLRRLPARDRNSSSGGTQDQSAAINSTLLASTIYGRQQLTSRLGPRSAPRPKRRHFHPQQQCTFEIQVNYGPAESHDQSLASASTDCHSMADTSVAAAQQLLVEQQSSSKADGSAASSQTAHEVRTGAAQPAEEPDLGMTLSEYIAQMHTTPVACNSVSGLGDESDEEQFAGHPSWHAAPVGGSILAAWGMSGTAAGVPQEPQSAGPSTLGSEDTAGLARYAAAAAHEPLAAEQVGHNKHQKERLGSCSSRSSMDEAMHVETDAFRDSEGPSDIECYPDVDSSSESEAEYQPDNKTAAGLTATDGDVGFSEARHTAWSGTSTVAPAASASVLAGNLRPQCSTRQRSGGILSPTMSSGDKIPPAPWMSSLDLRPATAASSLAWRGRTAADLATDPGANHNRPVGGIGTGSQQRIFTDLDSSADDVVKRASLGHLSAALFAPTAAAARDGSSSRVSLQQLWASSSSSEGGNSERSTMGRLGGHAPVPVQPQAGGGLCDGSVDEEALEETPSSSSGPGVTTMPQQPSTVVAWGAPAAHASTATVQQSAGDVAPTPVELINSNPKRLFNTRTPGPLYVTSLHAQGQQQALQRPPSRQRAPAQSLHLFTAAGFVPTQLALAGGQAGLFDSPPGTARVAAGRQSLDRPGNTVQQTHERRPMSANR